jgi:selenide,water dikinase
MGPEDLHKALQALPLISHPNLIAGMEHAEDAGVYRLTDDLAIVQTVDFFTPIVDDPYTFGQVAAVNALSDVYAMGGQPLTAMNIVCFPVKKMDIAILQQILLGGLGKMREAGVLLVGGHSVEDDELKYGLSVTGGQSSEKQGRPGRRSINIDEAAWYRDCEHCAQGGYGR